MRRQVGQGRWIYSFAFIAALFALLAGTSALYAESPAANEVSSSLQEMNSWLGDGKAGDGWRTFLKTEQLQAQLEQGDQADEKVVAEILAKFESGTAGLDRPQFVAVRKAVQTWLAELKLPTKEELPEYVLEYKDDYSPLTDEQVADAKQELQTAVNQLGRFLPARSKAGAGWRKYLEFSDLTTQLNTDAKPDLQTLVAVFHKLTSNVPGLEREEFGNVTEALADYIDLVAVKGITDAQEQYEKQLEALSGSLEAYADDPTEDENFNIGRRLGELATGRQAEDLISAVRSHHSLPNLFAEISHPLIEAGMSRAVDRNVDVRDNILGASIYGNGRMQGNVTIELIPSEDDAVMETVLKGNVYTNTTGSKSGVTFNSRGVTGFHARKRILFNEYGVTSKPARANAVTNNDVYNVNAGRIASRVAWDQIGANRATSNRIAGEHAAVRIRNSFDSEATPMLAKSSKGFMEKFRHPLVRMREFPEKLKFSTTENRLKVVGLKANRFQIAAPHAPPALEDGHDMAVRVHESFPGNMAQALMGGKTLTDEQLKEQILKMRGELPEELQNDEDEEPWSITFARFKPVTVAFDDNELEVTIRGQKYTSGEREFRAMNVTARYTLELTPTGSKMVRKGDLKIEPPDFAMKKRQLSASEISLKTILEKKFAKLFKEEVVSDGLELPGNWEKAGKLQPTQLASENGWLTVGWKMPSKDKVATGQAAREQDVEKK